jgi:hypothetical protein
VDIEHNYEVWRGRATPAYVVDQSRTLGTTTSGHKEVR